MFVVYWLPWLWTFISVRCSLLQKTALMISHIIPNTVHRNYPKPPYFTSKSTPLLCYLNYFWVLGLFPSLSVEELWSGFKRTLAPCNFNHPPPFTHTSYPKKEEIQNLRKKYVYFYTQQHKWIPWSPLTRMLAVADAVWGIPNKATLLSLLKEPHFCAGNGQQSAQKRWATSPSPEIELWLA